MAIFWISSMEIASPDPAQDKPDVPATFNARVETVVERSMFRGAFK
jgi:putative SOS response-associated peptidase YedK